MPHGGTLLLECTSSKMKTLFIVPLLLSIFDIEVRRTRDNSLNRIFGQTTNGGFSFSDTGNSCPKPGGYSHIKRGGMLVVSLKGLNFGF